MKMKRMPVVLAGIFVMVLIAASVVIAVFFPGLLRSEEHTSELQSPS